MQRNSYCSLNGPSFFVSKSKIPPLYIPPTLQIVRSALGPNFAARMAADHRTFPRNESRSEHLETAYIQFNYIAYILCSYTTFHRIVWRAWNLGKSVRNGVSTTYEALSGALGSF